jgi:aryl-alcohol dehydrogenase-like predicted oxidoreductase
MADAHNRIETDRKSLRKSMDKSIKSIRLKTDYLDIL